MSLILAISTSSQAASVSLVKSGSILAEPITTDERSHTKSLAPMIDELLSSFAINCGDIDYFAVDTGPGSFTGVRIGVATANGLAMGVNRPVVGVSSLMALRYQQREISPIATILDAHNDNVYAAIYYNKSHTLAPCALTIEELLPKLPPNILCIGDGATFHQQLIAESIPTARFASEDYNIIHASCVGLAAWDIIQANNIPSDGGTAFALPTYLKPSQAERLKLSTENG